MDEQPKSLDEILPRPASLWIGLAAAAALTGVAWLLLDPAGPLKRLRIPERTGLAVDSSRTWYVPYAMAIGGAVALGLTGFIDLGRVRKWAADRNGGWADDAYEWCKRRLPDRFGPEYLQSEIEKGRLMMGERLSRRWGRYYVLGFGVILAAFLAGLTYLKTPPKGIDPNTILYSAFYPLHAATAGVGVALLIVVVAAQIGSHTLSVWTERMNDQAIAEFRGVVVPGASPITAPIQSDPEDSGVIVLDDGLGGEPNPQPEKGRGLDDGGDIFG